MTWHFPFYTPIFILNVIICGWLSVSIWRRSAVPGVRVFVIMLIAAAFWSFTRLLEASADQTWAKIFWGKTEYIGAVVVGPAWFVFTCYYRYQLKRYSLRDSLLLSIVPIITVILVFTNEAHHLIWTDITPSLNNPEVLNYGHGIWFWLAIAYDHSFVLLGVWNVYQVMRTLPEGKRAQAKTLLIGAVIPIGGNVLYLMDKSPIKGMDLTPFFLTITAAIYFLTVFRYRLFDIRHVARAAIIDNMRDAMLVIDTQYSVVDVNPSASQLLALPTTIIEKDIRLVLAKYPAILDIITRPHSHPVTTTIGDDAALHLDILVSELKDQLGNPAGKLIVLRDVTERHTAEKIAFENAIEQHRLDLLNQFIRDISHEFRTPLSVINTNLYLMEKSDDPGQQKNRREVIQLQTKRLDYLINEMLTTVQLDADSSFNCIPLDLKNLLETVTLEQQPIFAAKHQRCDLHSVEAPIQVNGDLVLLQKAMTKILQNASRYTPENGTVSLTTAVNGDFAIITVKDSGVGMSEATQARIFERFFRADDAHTTPGFGLGLPIAQTIIEKHQGRVEVESELGVGTTFTIYLPRTATKILALNHLQLAINE